MHEAVQDHLDAPQLRALLVDDDSDQIQITAISLRKAGFAVSFANDVSQALQLFADLSFDVAVVDLGMGEGWGGIDLIGWMRQDRHGPNTRIVAWTASTDESVIAKALQAGADDCYQKHIGPTVLLAKMQRLAAECAAESITSNRLLRLERVMEGFARSQGEISDSIKAMREDIAPMREVVADWLEAQRFKRSMRQVFGWVRRFGLWIAAFATALAALLPFLPFPKAPK